MKSLCDRDLRWRSVPRPDSQRSVISVAFDVRVSYAHIRVRENAYVYRYAMTRNTRARLTYMYALSQLTASRIYRMKDARGFISLRFVFPIDITVNLEVHRGMTIWMTYSSGLHRDLSRDRRRDLGDRISGWFLIISCWCTRAFMDVLSFLVAEIAKVRASLFQISGVKKEPLVLPEPEGDITTLTEKVYVPVKEHPDVSIMTRNKKNRVFF